MKKIGIAFLLLNLILFLYACDNKKPEDKDNTQTDFTIVDNALLKYNGKESEVIIPDTVTKIASKAFLNMNNIYSIHLPLSLEEISPLAFSGCYHLVEAFNNSNIDIKEYFPNLKILNTSVSSKISRNKAGFIYYSLDDEDYLLDYSGNQESIIISEKYQHVADYAFYNNDKISNVIIGSKIKTIGKSSFANMANLEKVIFGDNVKKVDNLAFSFDPKLESLRLNKFLEEIKEDAFLGSERIVEVYNLSDLSVVNLFENLIVLHDDISEEELLKKEDGYSTLEYQGNCYLIDVKSAKELIIPDGVTIVLDYAFDYINKICILTVPRSVREFSDSALARLKHLVRLDNQSDLYIQFDSPYGNIEIEETNDEIIGIKDDRRILLLSLKSSEYNAVLNVTDIYQYAYTNVSSKYLVLYEDVLNIDKKALDDSNIEEIYFTSSEEDFDFDLDMTVYFYSEEYKEGNYWHFAGNRIIKWEDEKND